MPDVAQDRLASLDHLIAVLDERRVERMLRIAFLMADDADTAEAEKGLREIEAALVTMKGQRMIQQPAPASGSLP